MNTVLAYIWSGEGLLAQTGILSSGSNSGGGGTTDSEPVVPEETRYAHTDHLGTIKMLSNPAGQAVAGSNYSYTPFSDRDFGDVDNNNKMPTITRSARTPFKNIWNAGLDHYHCDYA